MTRSPAEYGAAKHRVDGHGAAKQDAPERRVAFFAFNWADAAVRRRVDALVRDGVAVDGFAMHRGSTGKAGTRPDWVVADLGETRDNAYIQRITAIIRGARRAARQSTELARADVIVARNLDMLATAFLARKLAGLKTPVVYECLDIHRLMVRTDPIGRWLRWAEGAMLAHTSALWVSSPAFLTAYFERYQKGRYRAHLVENRMTPVPGLGPRPASGIVPDTAPDTAQNTGRSTGPSTGSSTGPNAGSKIVPDMGRKLRLGWFGNLRCARSLGLMERLADRFPDQLDIILRGYPALGEIPDFEDRVAACPGIHYGGSYQSPEDLAEIYAGVDLVWAGDFMDAGFNSTWLLPNRLYEGGWFACPPIAPVAAQTGKWIAERDVGFTIEDSGGDSGEATIEGAAEATGKDTGKDAGNDTGKDRAGKTAEKTLPALIGRLIEDRAAIEAARQRLLALPDATFLQPPGDAAGLVEEALAQGEAVRVSP